MYIQATRMTWERSVVHVVVVLYPGVTKCAKVNVGGGGGGELKVWFAQTLPQILSLVNLYSISIKLGNN